MQSEFLTESEVALIVRRSVMSLRRWRRLGTGPRCIRGTRVLYPARDLASWLAAQPVGGGGTAAARQEAL